MKYNISDTNNVSEVTECKLKILVLFEYTMASGDFKELCF